MKILIQFIQAIIIIFLLYMVVSNIKSMNKQDANNKEIEEANKYYNLTSEKINELNKIVETKIQKIDSIMIYTNDTVKNIDVFLRHNINIEKGITNKFGQYDSMVNYFDPQKTINENKKRIANINFFIDNIDQLGFSIYHIDTLRNRNFILSNNINRHSTYYSIAQYKYLNDKQIKEGINYILESKDYLSETLKKKKIEALSSELFNQNRVLEIELKNQKLNNNFKKNMMPKLGIYKKSYYYFSCANNSLNEKQFIEKIKLFESMFMVKKKSYLKGRIIKAKVKNMKEFNTDINLNKRTWMN